MKTLELLRLLSSKERRQFESTVIKSHKRASLTKLYQYLKKNPEMDKKKLFVKVFAQQYNFKQDSLLRNELRLLNKEIEAFFTELQWLKEQQEQPEKAQLLLLQLYKDRKQENLYEQQWRKLYKKAQQEQLYGLKVTLINSYFSYHSQHSNAEIELYTALEELVEEGLSANSAYFQEQQQQLRFFYGFLQRNLFALHSGNYNQKQPPQYYQLLLPLENEELVDFYQLSTQACYYIRGEQKIELLKEVLKKAVTLKNHPRFEELDERIQNIRSTLALEYYILKRYEEADAIYQKIITAPLLGSIRSKIGITFNYFVNLLGLEDYERAIDWYEQQKEQWQSNVPVAYKAHCMICWAYHDINQPEKALDTLLHNPTHHRSEGEFAYTRLMLSITYEALGEEELAEREVYNLLQNTRYKEFKETVSLLYAKFIHQYYLALHTLDPDKRNSKIEQIRKDLEEMYQANLTYASTLIYRWLVGKLAAATL